MKPWLKLNRLQKIILITSVIGLSLGGIVGYFLAPRPNYSNYVSQISDLNKKISELEFVILTLKEDNAVNNANIAKYKLEITGLELELIELKAKVIEVEKSKLFEWEYEQLNNAYYELKKSYEELRQTSGWFKQAYYEEMEQKNWTLLTHFRGNASNSDGLLNETTEDFSLTEHLIKIRLDYRGDLYESFNLRIADDEKHYGPVNNYITLSTGRNSTRITYTNVVVGKLYHLELEGIYTTEAREDIKKGVLNLEGSDYIIWIYTSF